MALLTIADLQDDVADELPNKEAAVIVRAVNKVIRRIYTEFVEPQESTFTTVPTMATGTVSVIQDSTTINFSSSVLSSTDPVTFIQVTGDNAWFQVTYVSASQGTLSSKWAGSTNATATYQMVYPVYSFPAGIGEIISIGQSGFDPLKFRIGTRDTQTSWWWQMGVGLPTHWGPWTHDETAGVDNLRIIVTPAPLDRRVYAYTYKPRVARLNPVGATSQTIPLQDRWYEAICEGVLFFCRRQENESMKGFAQSAAYEAALSRCRGASIPAAIIPPKRRVGGLWVYENRPIS